MTITPQATAWMARAAVLLLVTPLHECAHGFVAWRLGDNTAHDRGRLTLNPVKHLSLWGSLALILFGFGWAKPVPVDPRNFRRPKRDMALTALAGPLANILFALLLLCGYQVMWAYAPYHRESYAYELGMNMVAYIIQISVALAVFNLLPVPPLDGSRILGAFLPDKYYFGVMKYERYIMILVMVLLYTGILADPLNKATQWVLDLMLSLTAPIGRIV